MPLSPTHCITDWKIQSRFIAASLPLLKTILMELFFRTFGEGPPLIILHGLYGSSENWVSIGKSLAEHFRVFLPDQRNHGRSPHSELHDYPSMRDDLLRFMDRQNLEKANLMGHSMGGKVIMHLAIQESARVDSLIVIDIAPQAYDISEVTSQVKTHTRILEAMLAVDFTHVHSREDVNTQLARSIYSPRIRRFLLKNVERTDQGEYRWTINVGVIKAALPRVLDGLDPDACIGRRATTGFPVLFIRGGESDYITDEMIPGIRSIFPGAEIVTIPDAGHWLHVERSSMLLKTVRYFLLGE